MKTPRSVSTGRELPFYTNIPSVEACSLHEFSLFPQGTSEELQGTEEHMHVLSPPCVKQSLLLPTTSAASSNERQHATWLLRGGKSHIHSIIYLATETSFDLSEVTFSSFCPPSPCVQWECLMCSYLVGVLIQYCSDWGV